MKVTVYTAGWCTYCTKLKDFLKEKGIEFLEVNIDQHPEEAGKVFAELDLETLPQVFIDGVHIGGCDDTIHHLSQGTDKVEQDNKTISFRELLGNNPEIQKAMATAINEAQRMCHGLAVEGGWWNKSEEAIAAQAILDSDNAPVEGSPLHKILVKQANEERNIAELLCLVHSEVSEAMEGIRKNLDDDKLPHRKMLEVELADAIVRILDISGGFGLDVGGALVEKLIFNISREDHKLENRSSENGKKF